MKKVGVVILGIVLFSILNGSVHAENITYERLNDTYYNLTVDGNTTSNHVTKFYLDGRLAYCIDPGMPINTKTYNSSTSWPNTLTDEQKQQIEKIGYYGFEYPNHQTDRYYVATQELIWKTIKNVDITWTNSSGSVIDLTKEKNEIESLVKKHSVTPSFINETISGVNGEKLEVTDYNNILKNFTLSQTKHHKIKIEDNKLLIQLSESSIEETVTLTRNNYDQKTLLIYSYPGSQTLASLRLSYQENFSFVIKSSEQPKEIVEVPNTGLEYQAKHFGIYKFKITHDNKFS
ncbi:MAG: thioester domain-containing protein [Bacilli bacterium]|nr:thioester domain-containing protein [Bacilli bacterium]